MPLTMFKLITLPTTPPTEVMAPHSIEHAHIKPDGTIGFAVMPWHDGVSMGLRDSFEAEPHPDGMEAAIRERLLANGFQDSPEA